MTFEGLNFIPNIRIIMAFVFLILIDSNLLLY